MKQARTTPAERACIVEKHWRDVWHVADDGLTVRDKITGRIIAFYPGV